MCTRNSAHGDSCFQTCGRPLATLLTIDGYHRRPGQALFDVRAKDKTIEAEQAGSRRRWGPAYKLAILAEYETLDRAGKGELLRRENLNSSRLSDWRKQRDRGAIEALASGPGRPPLDPVERENSRLRKQIERLESDLERARAVIEVQGKCSALLEELATHSAKTNGDATR